MDPIKIPSTTSTTKNESSSTETPSKLISLAHIKQSTLPSPSVRICWSDGIVFSNADQAAIAFIKRLQSRGKELTEQQKALLAKFYNNDNDNNSTTLNSSSSSSATSTSLSSSTTVHVSPSKPIHKHTITSLTSATSPTSPIIVKRPNETSSSIGIKRSTPDSSKKGGSPNKKAKQNSGKKNSITLTDKLSMSLDDLAKRSGNK